jgi:hypothetical protein
MKIQLQTDYNAAEKQREKQKAESNLTSDGAQRKKTFDAVPHTSKIQFVLTKI